MVVMHQLVRGPMNETTQAQIMKEVQESKLKQCRMDSNFLYLKSGVEFACKWQLDIGHESHWPETGDLVWELNPGPIKKLHC